MAEDILISHGQYDYIHENIDDVIDTVSSEYKVHPYKKLNGFYSYNGFTEPERLADTVAGLIGSVTVNHEYAGASADVTDSFTEALTEEAEALNINMTEPLTAEDAEDIAGFLYDFGVWINPTYEELADFNRSKMLDESEYIADIFESEAV